MAKYEKLENGEVKFDLVVSAETFENGLQAAFKKNRGRYHIPGFRKGKAPRKMIERYYGEGVFYEAAFDEIYWQPYLDAIKEADVQPVEAPKVDIEQIGLGQDLKFSATVAVRPELTVEKEQYVGIPLTKVEAQLSAEQVDHEIEHERQKQARFITVERPVKEGDRVDIDYSGRVDNELFEGGTAEGHSLDVGSGQFIPGFEEQLLGMELGSQKDITVTFPEEYHAAELAGKEAVFTVKINDIKEKELPELDDEFAKDVSDFDTFKEYKADLQKKMQESADAQADRERRDQAAAYLAEHIEFSLPEAMIHSQVDKMMDNMRYQLSSQGLGLEQYLGYLGMDVNSARTQMHPDAEKQVRTELILEAIIKKEQIAPSEESLQAEIDKIAQSIDKTAEEVREMIGENGLQSITHDLNQRAAMDLVLDKAKYTKPKKTPAKKKTAKEADDATGEATEAKPKRKTSKKKTEENTENKDI